MAPHRGPEVVLPESIQDDHRDVSDLWRDALQEYKGVVGFDLEKKFDSMQKIVDQGVQDLQNLRKNRYDDKKSKKLLNLFLNNIEYIEKGAQRLVVATAPMLLPAPTIGTAVTFFITACRRIQADYEMLIAFFEDMNSFLQRIVILETRMPRHTAYQNCLMDVFASFLTMCGYAHKYVVLGRFKRWVESLMYGEDGELSTARKTMDDRLNRLQNATEFAILGNTEDLKRLTSELGENQHNHWKLLEQHREVLGDIEGTTQNIAKDMARLLEAVQEQGARRGQSDRNDERKPKVGVEPTAKRIRNTLPKVEGDLNQYNLIKMRLLPDSCAWIFSQPSWNEWYGHQGTFPHPVLVISGPSGTGKSYLAASAYDRLSSLASKDPQGHTCVAQFYFKDQQESLSLFANAIVTAINQVAAQSGHLCDLLNARCSQDDFPASEDDLENWRYLTRLCLALCFNKDSQYQLYLILDGIDELESGETSEFLEFVKMVEEQELRIMILQTSRLDIPLPDGPTYTIELTKENQLGDMRSLIWNRLNSLNSLRSFSGYVKQRIADKVEEAAPNILYAEHMLDWLNSLEREGAVLANLERPLPSDLDEQCALLYESCMRNMSSSNQELAKMLLYLTVLTNRPVTLQEASSLIEFLADDQDFDIEGLLQPLSRIIQIGDYCPDVEERAALKTSGGSLTEVQDIAKLTNNGRDRLYDESELPLRFKERCMETFLLKGPGTDNGSRWSASKAHLLLYLAAVRLYARGNETGTSLEPKKIAKTYCIQYSLYHWRGIDLNEHSAEEQAAVMMAFWSQMSNLNDFASTIERYGDQDIEFPVEFCDKMRQWAEQIQDGSLRLPEDATNWWQETGSDPRRVFVSLAQAHTLNIYQASGLDESLEALYCLKEAISLANAQSTVIENARKWFPEEYRKSLKEKKAGTPLNSRKIVLGLVELFDTQMTSTAYRAVAELLLEFKYRGPAEMICRKAIDLIDDDSPLERFKSLSLMARILFQRKRFEEAYAYVSDLAVPDCVEDGSFPSRLRFTTMATKAKIEAEIGQKELAAKSFKDARTVDPSAFVNGDFLDDELSLYKDDEDQTEALNTLKQWTLVEKITWMCWGINEGELKWSPLFKYAARTGQTQLLIDMYEEAARYLSTINAEPPILFNIGKMLVEIGDLEAARQVVDKIFDSKPNGWPYAVTDFEPSTLAPLAMGMQAVILYNIFLKSSDPKVKMEILEYAKSLMKRPLILDTLHYSDSTMLPYRAALAQMTQKMGPARVFQESLQSLIVSCVNGLRDDEEWNNFWSWMYLPKVLYLLQKALPESEVKDEVIRALDIVNSARFSAIRYPETEAENDEDEDIKNEFAAAIDEMSDDTDEGEESSDEGETPVDVETDDDDDTTEDTDTDDELDGIPDQSDAEEEEGSGEDHAEMAADEGDLDEQLFTQCEGTCPTRPRFAGWGSKTGYSCFTCDSFMCEDCYKQRVSKNKVPGVQLCGQDHELWKGPIKGWRGIKDGKIRVEGQEDLDAAEFLDSIVTDLSKRAWDTFWLSV